MAVTIRDAGPRDAPALVELVGQLGYPASAEQLVARLARLAGSSEDRCVVAELEGELVGLASIHTSLSVVHDRPAAKLSAIVVGERHRGRGIGQALVAALEAEARARGCHVLFLTTAEHRAGAHAFYRRLGFAETGRRFAKQLG